MRVAVGGMFSPLNRADSETDSPSPAVASPPTATLNTGSSRTLTSSVPLLPMLSVTIRRKVRRVSAESAGTVKVGETAAASLSATAGVPAVCDQA